jgi:hypothetical protein
MPYKVIKAFWTGSRIVRAGVLLEEPPEDEAFGDCVQEIGEPEASAEEAGVGLSEAEAEPEPEEPAPVAKTWQKPSPKPSFKPAAIGSVSKHKHKLRAR